MVALKSVYSSNVAEIGYDEDASTLHVIYNGGRHAVYHGVPKKTADAVLSAPSIGEAMHAEVRGKFPFGYLK